MTNVYFSDHNNVLSDIVKEFNHIDDPSMADAVVVWNDVLTDYRNLLLQASLNGKPTFVMQHGLRASREYCPPYNKALLADKIMVWGPRDKQRLLQAGVEEDRISITGTTIFEHLIPRQQHEGNNVVYVPMHWYEELEENLIVAEKLREIPGINITTKIVDGEESRNFDNPIRSSTNSPDHLDICAKVLSTADLVVSITESTFEFLAYALDIPVIVVDLWKPKYHMGRSFIKNINSDNSLACKLVNLDDLPKAISETLSNPGEFSLERKSALANEAGFGIDLLTPKQRIIHTINNTVSEWKAQSIEAKDAVIAGVCKRVSGEITTKENATQKTIGDLQMKIQEININKSICKNENWDSTINFLNYPIAYTKPNRIESSAWIEHVPFGMFIIDYLRPRIFVELGTYFGVSYCSFCQAVRSLGFDSHGYAIDSWEGDVHSDFYGEQILANLHRYHDPMYGDFSRLVQSTFDNAVKYFTDNSIDLLHIDGYHTYEAVKHDFETWLPKLSERAVVLFHDTNVRERDFGVWRFWEEAKHNYPYFEFLHGHGLGVLGVGHELPTNAKQLFSLSNESTAQLRAFFFALGSRTKTELDAQAYRTYADEQANALKKEIEQIRSTSRDELDRERTMAREQEKVIFEERERQIVFQQELNDLKEYSSKREIILNDLNNKLLEIYSSTAWNIIRRMWRFRLWVAPKNSRRERFGQKLFGIFRGKNIVTERSSGRSSINGEHHIIKPIDQQSWVVMATKHTLFIANIITEQLRKHGCNVTITTSTPKDFSSDYYIVICPQMFQTLPPGEKRISFQMEQSVSSRWFTTDYLKSLKESLVVLDYSLENIEFLENRGVGYPHVYYLPIGASKNYGNSIPITEKKYDILFYGDEKSSPRRLKMLEALQKEFNLKIASEVFGPELLTLIRQSRYVINLHYYDNALLEMPRIQESISLGVPVISEAAQDQDEYPELAGAVRYFEQGSISGMLATVRDALKEDVKKEQIIGSAQNSLNRFEFMFDRFLIGMGLLPPSFAKKICIPTVNNNMVLSLPETITRRREFEKLNLEKYTIFDGIRKSPGWMGCALSYAAIAQNAIYCGIKRLLVMEDDVLLPNDFEEKISTVQEYLDLHDGEWDIFVGVLASLHPDAKVIKRETFKGLDFITIDKMTSTVCNIYSERALKLIASWDSNNTNVEINTIDRYLENQHDLKVILVIPYIVGHREDMNSTLWGFQNTQYLGMINKSYSDLREKIISFEITHSQQELVISNGDRKPRM